MIFDLVVAANYLDIRSLLNVACKTVANLLKGKTAQEIREEFNVRNDFTPAELAQVQNENRW